MKFTGDPIFIGGDGRSGTTLLSVILDSHPDLVVGPELHFNGPENLGSYVVECLDLLISNDPRSYGKGLRENKHYKLGTQFAKRCHRFGIEFAELKKIIEEQIVQTQSNLVTFEERCSLINAIGEYKIKQTGKKRWGIKIMREIRNMHVYNKIWPDAYYIHIIRDGRDVAASQMVEHGTWGYEDIKKAATGWVDIIDRSRKNAKGKKFLEVRYEDIVNQPKTFIQQILDFLGVPWHDNVLNHTKVEHTLFKNPYNHASINQVVKPINSSSIGRYKKDLTDSQTREFTMIAEKHLKELNYI